MKNADAWNYAIGLVRGAGLEPTEEFLKAVEKEKQGEISMEELKRFLDEKYKS